MLSALPDNAILKYEQRGKNITFVHTDVPPVFQGKGVGRILAKVIRLLIILLLFP